MADVSTLPTLEDSRYLRFITFAILYVAQGLPWGMFITAIPAWLAGQGLSAAEIGGFVAIAALPWSFKLVVGPLMDRFTFLAMGRRRAWIIGAQVGIVLGLIVLANGPDPKDHVMTIAWIGFLINSFCALQDVAVDGMAINLLPVNERARANAFMYGGQIAGISAAGAGGTWALSHFGLAAASIIIALATIVIMVVAILIRERHGERLLPWTAGEPAAATLGGQAQDFRTIFVDLFRALVLPMSLLLIACEFLNRASAGLFVAVSPVVTTQELGWLDTTYANWQASAGIAAAIFGIIVSPWVDRKGAGLALTMAIAIKLAVFATVGLFPGLWAWSWYFEGVIVVNNLASQVVTVAIIALFMNICSQKVAATQFAVYMATANLALSAGSGLVAPLDGLTDYAGMYLVAAGMNGLFLLLWPLFNLERHQQRLLVLGSE